MVQDFTVRRAFFALAFVAAAGCGGRSDDGSASMGAACVPGEQIECACFDGRAGAQVCDGSGYGYQPCRCDTNSPGVSGGFASGGGGFVGATGGGGYGTTGGSRGAVSTGGSGGTTAPALGDCTATSLAFNVVDAEYSTALDAIVLVSTNPSTLHIYDPVAASDRPVALPSTPVAVSVGPDGKQAAVVYDGFVSLVDLTAANVVTTVETTCDAFDVVLAGNGLAYVFPNTDQWVDIHSIDFSKKSEVGVTSGIGIYEKTYAKLHPNGTTLYGSTNQLSPSQLEEYDISTGPATVKVGVGAGPDFGQHEACGNVWMSLDGERIFSACGNVFHASLNAAEDLHYAGSLNTTSAAKSSTTSIMFQSIVHSNDGNIYAIEGGQRFSSIGNTVAANDGSVDVFDYQYFGYKTSLQVPCIETNTGKVAPHARFVFANSDGSKIWIVLNVGAGATWGVASIDT